MGQDCIGQDGTGYKIGQEDKTGLDTGHDRTG